MKLDDDVRAKIRMVTLEDIQSFQKHSNCEIVPRIQVDLTIRLSFDLQFRILDKFIEQFPYENKLKKYANAKTGGDFTDYQAFQFRIRR